ncbi:hypothetical protein [Ascidiimonas sp. W6]|uniref:hypothetical protein n=1 Tax=Ascidiimonas meishanensis TaxID=3128903 RepID=UPI0030EE8C30
MKKKNVKLTMVAVMIVSILSLGLMSNSSSLQDLDVEGIAKEVPQLTSVATPQKEAHTTTLVVVAVFVVAVHTPAYGGGGGEEEEPPKDTTQTLAMAMLD